MTVNLARMNELRERVESGVATPKEHEEWLRLREAEITEANKRLRKSETDFAAAFEQHIADATSNLRERIRGLAGAALLEAGRRLFPEFERQWGEEAARIAWKAVQPPKRHGRAVWQSIPPARRRGYHLSVRAHFQRASKTNRADLLATLPTQGGGTLSKEKAAVSVFGEDAADPSRQIRRIKAGPPIRD